VGLVRKVLRYDYDLGNSGRLQGAAPERSFGRVPIHQLARRALIHEAIHEQDFAPKGHVFGAFSAQVPRRVLVLLLVAGRRTIAWTREGPIWKIIGTSYAGTLGYMEFQNRGT
jgi:hypothetical protein